MTAPTKRRVQAKPERAHDIPRSELVSLWDWRRENAHLFPSDTADRLCDPDLDDAGTDEVWAALTARQQQLVTNWLAAHPNWPGPA